jgi:hypothetical protein
MKPKFTSREERILDLLLDGKAHSQKEIAGTCGIANVSGTVGNLSRKTGLQIPCQRLPVKDRDGKTVLPGFWRLTDGDVVKVRAWRANHGSH